MSCVFLLPDGEALGKAARAVEGNPPPNRYSIIKVHKKTSFLGEKFILV